MFQDKETFSRFLTETEDWLYEDGEDETRAVYQARLDDMKKMGNPVKHRYLMYKLHSFFRSVSYYYFSYLYLVSNSDV